MEGPPTYDDDPQPAPHFTVDSHSDVATASMPTMPFEERHDDETTERRP